MIFLIVFVVILLYLFCLQEDDGILKKESNIDNYGTINKHNKKVRFNDKILERTYDVDSGEIVGQQVRRIDGSEKDINYL